MPPDEPYYHTRMLLKKTVPRDGCFAAIAPAQREASAAVRRRERRRSPRRAGVRRNMIELSARDALLQSVPRRCCRSRGSRQ
jgi:hypothetical protein